MSEAKNKRAKGKEGEDIARKFLEKLGYAIIEENYQFGHGEIDLIADDNGEIVFVEVKTRKSLEYGDPETAITKKKIAQIKKVAAAYLVNNNITEQTCRIDAIAILLQNERTPLINHYYNVG
ncbi:MAG: putative endonuclease [Ignavibacteria bacterium]|nr:MAG: putative endonuclease [Ignavibacteria bacterium]KAF0160504.1 MAG: putative endonuclease [Ignavibacteria bacterium]